MFGRARTRPCTWPDLPLPAPPGLSYIVTELKVLKDDDQCQTTPTFFCHNFLIEKEFGKSVNIYAWI